MSAAAECPTWKVTTQYLHSHPDPCWRPPLWIQSDVLGHNLVKMTQLWGVVVCVPLKNLCKTHKYKSAGSLHWYGGCY